MCHSHNVVFDTVNDHLARRRWLVRTICDVLPLDSIAIALLIFCAATQSVVLVNKEFGLHTTVTAYPQQLLRLHAVEDIPVTLANVLG